MIFFSVQKFLKGNLKGSFVVKVFLMGITILDRRILFVKFWLWRALKVESRPSDLPPRYVLTRSVAGFLSFQLIFTVNSAHKNYKLYLPYSKTTLHLQNNFFAYGHYDESSLRLRSQKNRIEIS